LRLLRCYGANAWLVVEVRKPEGTRATLCLPLEVDRTARQASHTGGVAAKRRTFIVDDEPEARARLRRLLAKHADRVEIVGEAGDGLTALSGIESLTPELAFLDIEMPGLNGFQP
jgi:PleD family two-component response regulator